MRLGERQKLIVVKKVEFGVYLAERQDAGEKDRVLLPIKQVPAGTKEGDKLEVFLYKDSQDRLIATMRQPKLMLGETGFLRVAQVSRIGAFLDWGLEKDFFHIKSRPRKCMKMKKCWFLFILTRAADFVQP